MNQLDPFFDTLIEEEIDLDVIYLDSYLSKVFQEFILPDFKVINSWISLHTPELENLPLPEIFTVDPEFKEKYRQAVYSWVTTSYYPGDLRKDCIDHCKLLPILSFQDFSLEKEHNGVQTFVHKNFSLAGFELVFSDNGKLISKTGIGLLDDFKLSDSEGNVVDFSRTDNTFWSDCMNQSA